MYDISVFKCIWFLDSVEVILEPVCRHFEPDMTHITCCRNVISIKHKASAILVALWPVLPFRERKNFIWFG